ncbi:hypothetical protein [Planotetraspora kaengkrachanensis]|uniref:hypothetical protein n=1 Tax=Planotetraspora kaengkrachanensis TaxID=575193 RepID=UPI001940AAAF|nr:hypothetical protein [Planotetraspora kaengkrachanensis]
MELVTGEGATKQRFLILHDYGMGGITVLEFDAAVLKQPGMYFGAGLDDPRLPALLLSAAARHALHPATRVAEDHSLISEIVVFGDLCFNVTINQQHTWSDSPPLGYFDSLLGPEWWLLAAIATLCLTTTVEMWSDGRGFSQELAGLRPLNTVQGFDPQPGSGTRVTFTIDGHNLPSSAAFPADLGSIDAHGPDCTATDGPGYVVIRDHRSDDQSSTRLAQVSSVRPRAAILTAPPTSERPAAIRALNP